MSFVKLFTLSVFLLPFILIAEVPDVDSLLSEDKKNIVIKKDVTEISSKRVLEKIVRKPDIIPEKKMEKDVLMDDEAAERAMGILLITGSILFAIILIMGYLSQKNDK